MKRLVFGLLPCLTFIAPLVVSAALVAALVGLVSRPGTWSWYIWLTVSPLLYLCWLTVFLLISASICGLLGRRHPKPRHAILLPGQWRASKGFLGIVTANTCYRRLVILDSVPFVSLISQFHPFDTLFLRSYSPAIHIGRSVVNMGTLYDPDLTHISDNAVLGGRSAIVAHSMSIRPDGAIVYVSAPVIVGARATIGGEARVALGSVIGEDAIVEMGALVEPFTNIPPGEVWGGNPARFRRKRQDLPDRPRTTVATAPPAVETGAGAAPPTPRAAEQVAGRSPAAGRVEIASSASLESARRLVVDALSLDPEQVPHDLSSETCSMWDSLGQVAIAAALYDRYAITVDAADLYRLRTLESVAAMMPGHQGSSSRAEGPGPGAPATWRTTGLPHDIEMLPLLDAQEATRTLAAHVDAHPTPAVAVSLTVASSFVAEPIQSGLKVWGRAFGMQVDCHFTGYGQIVQTLLSAAAPSPSSVTLVLARPEDFASDSADAVEQLDQILGAVEHAASQRSAGRLLVGTLPPVVSSFCLMSPHHAETLRHLWRTRLEGTEGVEIFDFARVVEGVGIEQARNSQSEVRTRGPYSAAVYQELAIAAIRRIRAARRSPAKVIALDCDNTLWGGVVGEAGMDGLRLGPDGEGRGFQLFQRYIKHLKELGLLLVVVSKNEERDVREVFEHHPEMVLRPVDIAAWRVNWRHKSENLRELAEELSLGLDSFVLLDDDQTTRMEVETRLPEVHVVPLPADPAAYCETLARLWLFDGAQTTAVDTARTQMTQEELQRQSERRAASTLEAFLAGLELRVDVGVAGEHDWPRVAQLTQRTNQFNLSLKRRTTEDIEAIAGHGIVLALRAADRFGDYGLVGVCILSPVNQRDVREIDTLLMSCRALGRGVEDVFLHAIGATVAGAGATQLVARYVEGPRNAQIKDYLSRNGFAQSQNDLWTCRVNDLPAAPVHIDFRRSTSNDVASAERLSTAPATVTSQSPL